MDEWYQNWFNRDYLNLYGNRDQQEAEEQVDFIIKALDVIPGSRVLDLGCGTGRHALAFARREFSTVGVDLSPYLIQKAKKQAQQYPDIPLQFQIGDMRSLPDLEQFDLVINMFTSFGYFKTEKEDHLVLANIRNSLMASGKFFLDYLNPNYVESHLISEEQLEIAGEPVTIHRKIEKGYIIKEISFPGRQYEERVRLYEHKKLEKILETHHFQIIASWSNYQGTPWHDQGERQLFHCKQKDKG